MPLIAEQIRSINELQKILYAVHLAYVQGWGLPVGGNKSALWERIAGEVMTQEQFAKDSASDDEDDDEDEEDEDEDYEQPPAKKQPYTCPVSLAARKRVAELQKQRISKSKAKEVSQGSPACC